MKIKETFVCDVCDEPIQYPHFRVEWGRTTPPSSSQKISYDFIQVCHEDCSYGIQTGNNYPVTYGDIIFDQLPYDANLLDQRLNELSLDNPQLRSSIDQIKIKLLSD